MPEQTSPEELEQIEFMKKTLLKKILSKPAMERLARIKLVKPEVAAQLESYLVQLYNSGKIKSEVTEEQMKMVLETISGSLTREFRILRK